MIFLRKSENQTITFYAF